MKPSQSVFFAILVVFLILSSLAAASSVKVIYTFQGGMASGLNPRTPLAIDSAGNLYGFASNSSGGTNVYELSPSSSGGWTYQVIYQFDWALVSDAKLIFDSAGNLYSTTYYGGTYNAGIVFELSPSSNGTWTETTLYTFGAPGDGVNPEGSVVFASSGALYGTTQYGGASNNGIVFELAPNGNGGWTETILYSFAGAPDGAWPTGPVVFDSAGNLYGTTATGGDYIFSDCYLSGYVGCGTVYQLSPQAGGGWTEAVLHNFIGCCLNGNHDGQNPYDGVVVGPLGQLYGATRYGGACANGCGVVFELVHEKGKWSESLPARFGNKAGNGDVPGSGLVFDAYGNLYGTTLFGGESNGTLFALNRIPEGFQEKVLYSFTGNSDGSVPEWIEFAPDGKFYGVAFWGGNAPGGQGDGTIFEGRP
jgi:uncharacterized repeat protein (TIGR03803 family)